MAISIIGISNPDLHGHGSPIPSLRCIGMIRHLQPLPCNTSLLPHHLSRCLFWWIVRCGIDIISAAAIHPIDDELQPWRRRSSCRQPAMGTWSPLDFSSFDVNPQALCHVSWTKEATQCSVTELTKIVGVIIYYISAIISLLIKLSSTCVSRSRSS